MLQPTCQSFQLPQRRHSITRIAVCERIVIREFRAVRKETYWSLSVRSINAEANLAWWGYEHALRADIRRADLSLSLFISCLACNHPVSAKAAAWLVQCRINSPSTHTGKICTLILNDSSCITETILIAFLTEGCLKVVDEGMGLYHSCDLPDSLHFVWVGADRYSMVLLLVRYVRIDFSVLLFSLQKSWRIICKTRFSLYLIFTDIFTTASTLCKGL